MSHDDLTVEAATLHATVQRMQEQQRKLMEWVDQMQWVDQHGCVTGDCDHMDVHECMDALVQAIFGIAREAKIILESERGKTGV